MTHEMALTVGITLAIALVCRLILFKQNKLPARITAALIRLVNYAILIAIIIAVAASLHAL